MRPGDARGGDGRPAGRDPGSRWNRRSDELAGKRVLDAGCGTGQRVVGFTYRYPAGPGAGN
jgi:SAM-dependent methyltransferase